MKRWNVLILMIITFLFNDIAHAYDEKITHPQITKEAINQSILDDYLISNLGIMKGSDQIYNGSKITDLLRAGSTNEDSPLRRARHHFWNPLNNSGLDDLSCGFALNWVPICWYLFGNANRDWAMGVHAENEYSWADARNAYYAAMTRPTEAEREENFILMYESLGHIMHLIEDMGVPAHTRNDMFGHLDYMEVEDWWNPIGWAGNLYEYRVKDKGKTDSNYIAGLCEEQGVNIPEFERAEDYWDIEVYDGTNPERTMPTNGEEQAGLAEYCNANFLSECAMFTNHYAQDDEHYFPYPRETSLSSLDFIPRVVTAEDGKEDTVRYLEKDRDGESIPIFVGAKYMWTILEMKSETEFTEAYKLGFKLDDNVHDAYAEKLIPKAVGYAAGVLDYFFRGSIEITLPDNGVYAFLSSTPSIPDENGFNRITLMVRNTSPNNERMTGGSIELVVEYRVSEVDPFVNHDPWPDSFQNIHYIVSPYGTGDNHGIPRDNPMLLEFDLPQDIPLWATDVYLYVVYKGKLGTEEGAVCVGFKDISEPTAVPILNVKDMLCINDTWYHVSDPNGIEDARRKILEVAPSNWEYSYWYAEIEPYDLCDTYIRFSAIDNETDASSEDGGYIYVIPLIEPGKYKILYLLSDYNFYCSTYSQGLFYDVTDTSLYSGVLNQIRHEPDINFIIRDFPIFNKYRGIEMWKGLLCNQWFGWLCFDIEGECPGCSDEDITFNITSID